MTETTETTTLPTCGCLCDCAEPATDIDDGGAPVCAGCYDYWTDPNGDIHCGNSDEGIGDNCPDCLEPIAWGRIQTGGSGCPNYIHGTCGCAGRQWSDTERGNGFPGDISYSDTDPEIDEY